MDALRDKKRIETLKKTKKGGVMKRHSICLFLFTVTLLWAIPIFAMEFQSIGFNAMSMGGAGVASSRGSFAAYYNPALLAEYENGMEISLSAEAAARDVDLAKNVDQLSKADLQNTINQIAQDIQSGHINPDTQGNIKVAIQALDNLAQHTQNGLQLMPSASLGVQVRNFGFGAYGVSAASAHAIVDSSHLSLIVEDPTNPGQYYEYNPTNNTYSSSTQTAYEQSSLEYALKNKLTYMHLSGLVYLEIPVAYGHRFTTKLGTLDCGGALKIMPGVSFDEDINIDTKSGDIDSKLRDAKKSDTSWGVDMGLLFKPAVLPKLSLGLVGKNLNTPKFDASNGKTLNVDPQVRMGAAYNLLDSITLALDADITNNNTFIPGYDSQFIGGGIDFHPLSWLSLRGGAMRNMRESNDGTIFTAGMGFGLKWFQLELAGQFSTEKGEYDGHSIPKYSRAEISLVSNWL